MSRDPWKNTGAASDTDDRGDTEDIGALRARLARVETLIRFAPVGFYESKLSGDYGAIYISPGVETLVGHQPDDFLSDSGFWLDHIHPEDRDRVLEGLTQVLEKGSHYHEYRFRHKDGAYLWMQDMINVVYDSSGTPERLIGCWTNVTDRVHAELHVKQLNQRLEQRNRKLEATVRELESFSYSVSHDLRAPLRAVDGFSQALYEDHGSHLDEEAQKMVGRIRAASQRMGQLIDDLLGLSRIARSSLHRERIDLSAMVADVAEGLRAAFPDHPVELSIAPGVTGFGDRRLLRILMENLLGNAWKYTAYREPARVALGTLQQDGEPVYFVRDNGAGFDMRYVHKLFGPFQRLHAKSEFPGTGIGLATAARIVGLHDGRIWAEGAVDQGATFYFTLGAPEDGE